MPAADTGGRDLDGDGGDPVDPAELPPAPDGEYPDAERWRFYAELPPERRRTWRNRITARSLERYATYEPGAYVPGVAVPLLVVLAEDDTVTPSDLIRDAVRASGGDVESAPCPGVTTPSTRTTGSARPGPRPPSWPTTCGDMIAP